MPRTGTIRIRPLIDGIRPTGFYFLMEWDGRYWEAVSHPIDGFRTAHNMARRLRRAARPARGGVAAMDAS